MHKKYYNLHTSRELVSPICLSPSCLQADWYLQETPSNLTTSNQFESHIFWSNFLKLVLAAQDYDILHSSHFPEIPGGTKWTFSSQQTFKRSSGEPKVIQLVTWYHILFLGPCTINCRTPDWQSSLVYWLENLEGSIFAWLFGRLSVTVTTVLMLLWPLKMLKLFKLWWMMNDGWWMMDDGM